jgi:hypothetical protein
MALQQRCKRAAHALHTRCNRAAIAPLSRQVTSKTQKQAATTGWMNTAPPYQHTLKMP